MIHKATHYTRKEGGDWIPIISDPNAQIEVSSKDDLYTNPMNVPRINYVWCLETWKEKDIAAIKFDTGYVYDFIIAKMGHALNPWRTPIQVNKTAADLAKSPVEKNSQSALSIQEGGSHYKDFTIQPIEYITKNSIPYPEGNVIKYVSRHSKKNGIEDIKKAIHYLQLIAELQYGVKL